MQRTGGLSFYELLPLPEPASSSHYILEELRDVGLKGRKVDFLYAFAKILSSLCQILFSRCVDEVQDNLLIDTLSTFSVICCNFTCPTISVLRTLCNNQHGLFWAGDTAQVSGCFPGIIAD